eukprot:6022449-Prymnesium_polylepis.1
MPTARGCSRGLDVACARLEVVEPQLREWKCTRARVRVQGPGWSEHCRESACKHQKLCRKGDRCGWP